VAHFDFGLSFQYEDQAVSSLILRSWPPTAVIGTLAFVMIVIFGSASASSPLSDKTTWVDYLVVGFSTVGASTPAFVLGIILIIIFSVTLYRNHGRQLSLPTGSFALDQHLILPW